jgi:hypothetical protein
MWAGHVISMLKKRNAYRILVGKPAGKSRVERPRCRWENNIKMSLRDIDWGDMSWINQVHERDQWRALVNTIMSSVKWKYFTGGFSRRSQLHGVS